MGDFNENLSEDIEPLVASNRQLKTLMSDYHFDQIISSSTTDTGSLIDKIVIIQVKIHTVVFDCYYSDHDVVCAILTL